MEHITLGQLAVAIALLAGLITGGGVIGKTISKALKKAMRAELGTLEAKVDELGERVEAVDMAATKNYLVSFLSTVESGGDPSEIERERFFEQWNHYERIGGNSYIKRKVEQLEKEGKL